MPNFARACGRVSVGRYPDKRPDSRQGMKNRGSTFSKRPASLSRDAVEGLFIFATVTGSRRRTGAPRSQRGTRLKATTDRAFLVSTRHSNAGAGLLKRLVLHCQVCGREIPNQSTAAQSDLSFWLRCASIAQCGRERMSDIVFLNGSPSLGRLGECYDRHVFRNSCATAAARARTPSLASWSTSKSCATTSRPLRRRCRTAACSTR